MRAYVIIGAVVAIVLALSAMLYFAHQDGVRQERARSEGKVFDARVATQIATQTADSERAARAAQVEAEATLNRIDAALARASDRLRQLELARLNAYRAPARGEFSKGPVDEAALADISAAILAGSASVWDAYAATRADHHRAGDPGAPGIEGLHQRADA